jgi:hypothetical protein
MVSVGRVQAKAKKNARAEMEMEIVGADRNFMMT